MSVYPEGAIKNFTVLRRATPVDTGADQIKDPYLRALEERYAAALTEAQQLVQNASLAPGADIIYSSPQQKMAQMERGRLIQLAAQQYNSGLRPEDIINQKQRKNIAGNPFYG